VPERVADGIRQMAELPFAGLVLAGTGALLAAFAFIWRNWRRARLLEDTPTARIRSAPQGYVELEGEGRPLPGPPIVAPLTGTPCLWYRYRVEIEEEDSHGQAVHRRWRTLASGVSDALFEVDDGTGRCVIDPEGAEVVPDVSDTWYGDTPKPAAGPKRLGRLTIGSGDYRYTEERLLPGHLYAVGWFESVRPGDGDLRAEISARLRAWKQDPGMLLRRFDRNGDGEIDAAEWEHARAEAERETLAERAERAVQSATHLLRLPTDGRPFILSAEPQARLAGRFRRRALGALLATALVALALGWVLWARFSA